MFIFYVSKIFRGGWIYREFECKWQNSAHVRQVSVQWGLSLFLPSTCSQTVWGVLQACTKKTNNTKQNGDLGGKILLLVTLQQFLVEEQVCLRVEYPWFWYRLNSGITDVHPLALEAAAGVPRSWQVPVVRFYFPLGSSHFYICSVVAPPHRAAVFDNPIQAVEDTLTSCQVLAGGRAEWSQIQDQGEINMAVHFS